MKAMYTLFILMIMLDLSMGSLSEFFNLTLTMPNINTTMSDQSVYIAMKLPINEDLYLVDFHPIYNRQKVHFITTYLCSKPYLTKENFWFGYQPCDDMDESMVIYEWYYDIPAVQWPKDVGFPVGTNTPYRYVVIHIQYFLSDINEPYGQQITIGRTRPLYKIGTYPIVKNSLKVQNNYADFSCRYHSSVMQIFSAQLYSKYEGHSISLYRVRDNQLHSIIKGNLHWSQTFYELENPIDIQANDYLIGTCTYKNESVTQIGYINRDVLCQITIMFWVKQEEEISSEICWNNDYSRVVERFLPTDAGISPKTLFDINPTYPKLAPKEWAIANMEILSLASTTTDSSIDILSLTDSKDDQREETIHLTYRHKLLVILSIFGLAAFIGCSILCFIIIRSGKNKKYSPRNKKRTKSITIGGATSSLSGWLTNQRFQQYDLINNHDNIANESLRVKHRWASESEESDLSDNEVFITTDFQNVLRKN